MIKCGQEVLIGWCFVCTDHMYTGTADGKILDIHKGEIRVLARLGKEPCGKQVCFILYTCKFV